MAHASWGSGWPHCQHSKINKSFSVDTRWGRVTFPGGVRRELEELIARLVRETSNRGYRFGVPGNPSYGCWGFDCRQIRGSSEPSNHSWGTAIDINAPQNPMGKKLKTNMPAWMPDLWNAYGFRWGGDYVSRPDAMHYEFMGSLGDAVRYTQMARANRLGDNRSTPSTPSSWPAYPGQVKMGSTGNAVKVWQQSLNRRGYGLKVDGVFGAATNHVVHHFQNRAGLKADGIAGPKTWHALTH